MLKYLCAGFITLGGLVHVSAAEKNVAAGEWKSLFNGKNLNGWTAMNEGVFMATNGTIHLAGGSGWLRTKKEFTNFVFETEWRARATNYNSGFFLRAGRNGEPFPTNVWQVNLKEKALGELLQGSKKRVTTVTPPRPLNEWTKFRMEARGKKLTLEVNGSSLWEFDEFDAAHGYLGLQAEGKSFDFRNLRVQVLP